MKVRIEFDTMKPSVTAKIFHDGKPVQLTSILLVLDANFSLPSYSLNVPTPWLEKLIDKGEIWTLEPINPSKRKNP